MSQTYGKPPVDCGTFERINLNEVMYYLYLPVNIAEQTAGIVDHYRLPPNLRDTEELLFRATKCEARRGRRWDYTYLSARKGWATPDNPLNRPGWHCDGFGSPDMNYVWWSGKGTRFLAMPAHAALDVSDDHIESLQDFEDYAAIHQNNVFVPPSRHLYQLDRYVIHATPELTEGQMRQYVKISFSNERYNLYGNSHNYLFDYDWPMVDRETVRNDTSKAQGDHG